MKQNTFILAVATLFLAVGFYAFAGMGGEMDKEKTDKKMSDTMIDNEMDKDMSPYQIATFAGGCFWCTESDFEKVNGVKKVISGYTGGHQPDPSYKEVSGGGTGHAEAVQVYFDPKVVSYKALLDYFWRHIDPTDPGGQFVDRGNQYRSEIFYHSDQQKMEAMASKKRLENAMVFDKPIVTAITKFEVFYPAEEYHQDYYKKNPYRYKYYRWNSGRDQFIETAWKETDMKKADMKDETMKMDTMDKGESMTMWNRPRMPRSRRC